MANLAAEAGDQVLNFVKATGLDFKIVQTPFSLEIKIKKKFIKYNPGSQQKTTVSKLSKTTKPSSSIIPISSQPIPQNVTATSNLSIMAKPTIDSCATPLPILTSHNGTSSPYMIHPMPTVKNISSKTAPMPRVNFSMLGF
jgi:hypothetical protein